MGHLPHLGVQEQKGAEQQKQGQDAAHQPADEGDLVAGIGPGPHHHGQQPEADRHVGHRHHAHVDEPQANGVGPRVVGEQRRQHGRHQHEHGQLDAAHPVGKLHQTAAPQPVDRAHRSQRNGNAGAEHPELCPPLEPVAEGGEQLDEEHQRQERHRPGEHVGAGPILVDDVGHTPPDEPPLNGLPSGGHVQSPSGMVGTSTPGP